MNTLDAHGILRSHLLRGRFKARKNGKTIAFCCPRHSDSTASAWLGDHAWGCSACGFTEPLGTLGEQLGVELPKASGGQSLTLQSYAERKGLSLDALARAGVVETQGKFGDTILAIPYRDADGNTIRTKYRTQKGTFWGKDGEGTPLYGQDVLASAHPDAPVLIVEGESDCHAGWQRGLCVVGLPGASMWKPEYAAILEGRSVFVWQEPDEGGATLVAAVKASLPKAKVLQNVQYRDHTVKDLCDLHQAVQESQEPFDAVWQRITQDATPIGAEGPVVAFDSISGDTLQQLLDEKLAPVDAVPTMLPLWNLACGGGGGGIGLARSWFVTIGANTGTGKSLIGLNLAHEAIKHGEAVTFLSLEMGRSELATRLMAIVSGEAVSELEQGPRFSRQAFDRAARKMDDIRAQTGGHVLVNRKPLSKLQDVTTCMRFYAENHGSRYMVVDYLQLAWTQAGHNIHERIELVAHQLRDLAQTLGITLVALSQFNRQTSADRSVRPVAQGLMGGSAVENDSHQVLLFDHSRFTRNGQYGDTWLIIDKNRHGSVCDIPVRWDYRSLRLEPRIESLEEQEKKHGNLSRYGRGL